jgi:hypothetical protein
VVNAEGQLIVGVYHQMGHQSENLITEPRLSRYQGAIFSPVNYTRERVTSLIPDYRALPNFELIFDPQLYYPRTEKAKLRSWDYFPDSYETSDFGSPHGWSSVVNSLARNAEELGVHSVCSPVVATRHYNSDYYSLCIGVAEMLETRLSSSGIGVLQTFLVSLDDLADFSNAMSVASVLTSASIERFYIVFISSSTNPRRELAETDEIKGAMLLVSELKSNGFDVTVGFCSSDVVLWKAAGADSCATGKFWNTRRFNPSRWGTDSEGGNGQIAYMLEEGLLAFLRDTDVQRTDQIRAVSTVQNPFYQEIIQSVNSGQAWVGLGWRQYLYWFGEIEERLRHGTVDAHTLVRLADSNWGWIEDESIIMEERQNNGQWLRSWLRALIEYQRPW